MRKHFMVAVFALTLSLTSESLLPMATYAQQGMAAPNVSVVTLQTYPGQNGQQMVVTPRGMAVPLPGPGVNGGTVQIYMGAQGGYWYVDRNNQNVDLTADVQRLQARISQNSYQQVPQVPQYAPQPVTVNNYENNSTSESSGSGAGTAAMAGLGAMAGAAMGSAMWGSSAPYGTPYYYGAGGHPYYYGANNKPVYVNNSRNVSGNTVNRTVDPTVNTANVNRANVNTGNVNNAHFNQMQDQQRWYENQRTQNPAQFQQWQNQRSTGSNPFVHQQANFGNGNFNNTAAAQQRNGNFNNGAAAQQRSGNFAQSSGRNFSGAQQQRQSFSGANGGGRFGGGRRR
ncbi:MAG: hypothetical protein K2W82_07840 [Candidatus Obscuribacterales bacterium]|nr:hypothetical protein [Candidatus Obscuribacterales bacterium]